MEVAQLVWYVAGSRMEAAPRIGMHRNQHGMWQAAAWKTHLRYIGVHRNNHHSRQGSRRRTCTVFDLLALCASSSFLLRLFHDARSGLKLQDTLGQGGAMRGGVFPLSCEHWARGGVSDFGCYRYEPQCSGRRQVT